MISQTKDSEFEEEGVLSERLQPKVQTKNLKPESVEISDG